MLPSTVPVSFLRLALIVAGVGLTFDGSGTAAEPAPVAERPLGEGLDPAQIYRYNLLTGKVSPIGGQPPKPGHVYLRHSPSRNRHVWSRVDPGGVLRYDLGPGSVIPARYFDLVADMETRRSALASAAPELAQRLAVSGARPSVRLGDDGLWHLDSSVNEGRVFDRATGQRFEWQMGTPTPVMHSGGNAWHWDGGGYRPTTRGYGGPEPTADWACGCR